MNTPLKFSEVGKYLPHILLSLQVGKKYVVGQPQLRYGKFAFGKTLNEAHENFYAMKSTFVDFPTLEISLYD